MATWFAERALVGANLTDNVVIECDGERISHIAAGAAPPEGATRLSGITIPGLVNAHSHAFHRALRGRTHSEGGDFWTWRDLMFRVAERLDPDNYYELALATFVEMALAGITAVGEFHYVHHQADGTPYDERNAMGDAVIRAASDAGIRMTFLDTCYFRGGLRTLQVEGVQRRFSDGDVAGWIERVSSLDAGEANVGGAIHSVRAVDPSAMEEIAAWARDAAVPLHMHASEQKAENEECQAVFGMSPIEVAAQHGVLGPQTTIVHGTHVSPLDVELLATSRTGVCMCPTTERDLADGVGPGSAFAGASIPLSLGSDGHTTIDLFEEARALEMDERLVTGRRGIFNPMTLMTAATRGGAHSLGWNTGALEEGLLCDLVVLDATSPRLATADDARGVVFCASAADVTDVIVGGRRVVSDRHHVDHDDVGRLLAEAVGKVTQ